VGRNVTVGWTDGTLRGAIDIVGAAVSVGTPVVTANIVGFGLEDGWFDAVSDGFAVTGLDEGDGVG